MAPTKDAVWPPQTTEDVLNLSPRKPRPSSSQNPPFSPSPLRHSTAPFKLDGTLSDPEASEEDEDEETLKLKLAQIEAKLRLKKLEKKKNAAGKAATVTTKADNGVQRHRAASTSVKASIQVPHSPLKPEPAPPKSPSRVVLGIDKGLKGRDVSLRRAPSLRTVQTRAASPPRPGKTFSQRIAEERTKEKLKYERQQQLENSRSKGFGMFGETSTTFTAVVSNIERSTTSHSTTSTNFRNNARPATASGAIPNPFTSTSLEDSKDENSFDAFSGFHLSRRIIPHVTLSRHLSPKTVYLLPHLLKTIVSPDFEPPEVEGDWVVMGIICSKSEPRDVGQNTTKKNGQSGKYMVMQLTDLKWEVELFLFGSGFEKFWKLGVGTVVAILNPGVMRPRNSDTGRFSLTLSDSSDTLLEIGLSRDLGFCKSIKRDGKQCASWVDKRHTHYCTFHVDQGIKKTRVGRAEVNSMSKLFSPPKKGTMRPKRFFSRRAAQGEGRDDGLLREGPLTDLPQRAGGAGGRVFVAPGRSTASLLDDNDYLADGLHRGTKEERLRKRLANAEKERQITKRLIQVQGKDGGIGLHYLRKGMDDYDAQKNQANEAPADKEEAARKRRDLPTRIQSGDDITALRKRAISATDVRLSPVKRKRMNPPSTLPPPPPPPALVEQKKVRFPTHALATYDDDDDDLEIV